MQCVDPVTGLRQKRSTRTTNEKKAKEISRRWEAELNANGTKVVRGITWAAFRERYEDEVLPGLAVKTGDKVSAVFNILESILPKVANGRLSDLTAERVSYWQQELRRRPIYGRKRTETTIASHTAHLRAALAWAVDSELLEKLLKIRRPKRAKKAKNISPMKGRPITTEEFERMLAKAEYIVGPIEAPAWRYYLTGLWWSGLRLAESLSLYWDRDDRLCEDLSGKWPMLQIPAELEKGCQDRLLPIASEFAEMLLATPEEQHTGRVFRLRSARSGKRPSLETIAKTVSRIGWAAGIKVYTHPKSGKVKYASAHDLRRSFGERWATRVMPQVLMILMRHESIQTSMRYYVGRNAQTAAEAVWTAYRRLGPPLGPTCPDFSKLASSTFPESHCENKTY